MAYLGSEGGRTDVWVKFVGGGPAVNLTAGSGLEVQSQATVGGLEISPDGSAIAVQAGLPGTSGEHPAGDLAHPGTPRRSAAQAR